MNTFLQCLMSIPEFTDYFLSSEYIDDLCNQLKITMKGTCQLGWDPKDPSSCSASRRSGKKEPSANVVLTRTFGNMIREIAMMGGPRTGIAGPVRSYNPRYFHEALQKLNSDFAGATQHDCQEALTLTLDAIHESLKYNLLVDSEGIPESSADHLMLASAAAMKESYRNNFSKVSELFDSQILQGVFCTEPDRMNETLSRRFEIYNQVNLEIPDDADNVYDCLDKFFEEEILDADNLYFDEKQGKKVNAKIVRRFVSLPKYLILTLKRFKQNMYGVAYKKIMRNVAFPFGDDHLDLSDYVEGYDRESAIYELNAVAIHAGQMGFGHYFAYGKGAGSPQFYEYNDETVKPIELEKVMGPMATNGYLFVYKRINSGKA
jgi:ubiquitin C-terminal hydrolase